MEQYDRKSSNFIFEPGKAQAWQSGAKQSKHSMAKRAKQSNAKHTHPSVHDKHCYDWGGRTLALLGSDSIGHEWTTKTSSALAWFQQKATHQRENAKAP